MLNTKEYFNQLDAIAVTELDNETSATIQGGYNLQLFNGDDVKTGLLGSFNSGGKPRLIANDQISSILVNSGQWRFYEHADYKGAAFTVGKGRWTLKNHSLNNKISSFQKVG